MSISVDAIVSWLSSTPLDCESSSAYSTRVDLITTALDVADGVRDQKINRYSALNFPGAVEQIVRVGFSGVCAPEEHKTLVQQLRRFIPTHFTVRVPAEERLVPAPSVALSDLFREFDTHGFSAKYRNNGAYDLFDLPLAQVRDRIQHAISAGVLHLSPTDEGFLRNYLGFDINDGFAFDPLVSASWLSRWSLLNTESGCTDRTTRPNRIAVAFIGMKKPAEPTMERAIQLLEETLYRVADAAELTPCEWPRALEIVRVPGSSITHMVTGFSESDQGARVIDALHADCETASALYFRAEHAPLAPQHHTLARETEHNLRQQFATLTRRPWSDADLSIRVPWDHLAFIAKELEGIRTDFRRDQQADLVRALMSPIAIAFAHELVHIHEIRTEGFVQSARLAHILETGLKNPTLPTTMFFGLCAAIPGLHVFQVAYERNIHHTLYTDLAFRGAVDLFHSREWDAHLTGFYIAVRAGYMPEFFSDIMWTETPWNTSHPTHSEVKSVLQALAVDARTARMVAP